MTTRPTSVKHVIFRLYDRTIDIIVVGLVFIMLCLLLLSFYDVLVNIKGMLVDVFRGLGNDAEFRSLVGNVLDVFIVIELFSTFMDYVKTHHVRLSTLLDVTVVFALREMLLKLYDQKFSSPILMTLSGVILVLVVCRSLANRHPPKAKANVTGEG